MTIESTIQQFKDTALQLLMEGDNPHCVGIAVLMDQQDAPPVPKDDSGQYNRADLCTYYADNLFDLMPAVERAHHASDLFYDTLERTTFSTLDNKDLKDDFIKSYGDFIEYAANKFPEIKNVLFWNALEFNDLHNSVLLLLPKYMDELSTKEHYNDFCSLVGQAMHSGNKDLISIAIPFVHDAFNKALSADRPNLYLASSLLHGWLSTGCAEDEITESFEQLITESTNPNSLDFNHSMNTNDSDIVRSLKTLSTPVFIKLLAEIDKTDNDQLKALAKPFAGTQITRHSTYCATTGYEDNLERNILILLDMQRDNPHFIMADGFTNGNYQTCRLPIENPMTLCFSNSLVKHYKKELFTLFDKFQEQNPDIGGLPTLIAKTKMQIEIGEQVSIITYANTQLNHRSDPGIDAHQKSSPEFMQMEEEALKAKFAAQVELDRMTSAPDSILSASPLTEIKQSKQRLT